MGEASQEALQPGGAGVRAELGGVGSSPEGASGASGLLKVARRAQRGDPGMQPHLTQGQGGTASRLLATLIQNWLVMRVPSPMGSGQALAKMTWRPSLLKGMEVTQGETQGLLLNVPPPSDSPV